MNIHSFFNFDRVDASWHECIHHALAKMDVSYLEHLKHSTDWLPGAEKIFNAFSVPLHQVNYILLGESPYPRAQSANGYAFWDAAVASLWAPSGLSKPVNRAASLRNFIKMLLVAEGLLGPQHTTQPDIAALVKNHLVQTNSELFQHLLDHGFLLLNASLVLQATAPVSKDIKAWQGFMVQVIDFIIQHRPGICLLLLGGLANQVLPHLGHMNIKKICAEHPYNLSFIQNLTVLQFFQPFHLLRA